MFLLKNNIEIWSIEKEHIRLIDLAEERKTIVQALMKKGVN